MKTEQVIVLPRPVFSNLREMYSSENECDKASRGRKRVTFDLDLQVHTIPNRIPIYERKPATCTPTKSPPLTFVPRPLDLRGRDRHAFGNKTNGKIIDLFSPANGFPAYTLPNGYKGVQKHWHPKKAIELPTFTVPVAAKDPYASFSTARHQVKLSKAAASLRDITAELRDQFEQSYQPFLHDDAKPSSRVTSASSTQSIGSVTQGKSKQQHVAVSSYSATKFRTNSCQGKRRNDEHKDKGPHESSQPATRLRSASLPTRNTSTSGHVLRRVPSAVSSDQNKSLRQHANSGTHKNNKQRISMDLNTVVAHFDDDPQHKPTDVKSQKKNVKLSSGKSDSDRVMSRCSTIDTYVISEDDFPTTKSVTEVISYPAYHGRTRTTNSRILDTHNRRSIAWGLDCEASEDNVVDVNNSEPLTTFQTKEVPCRLTQWHISQRTAKLTT